MRWSSLGTGHLTGAPTLKGASLMPTAFEGCGTGHLTGAPTLKESGDR